MHLCNGIEEPVRAASYPPRFLKLMKGSSMEKAENSTRERGTWSNNVAAGYKNALDRCTQKLEEAIFYLTKQYNEVNAQKSMQEAQACMDEANRWFNRANNQHFRIEALIREIKAHRSGVGVTYPAGQDPLDADWALLDTTQI